MGHGQCSNSKLINLEFCSTLAISSDWNWGCWYKVFKDHEGRKCRRPKVLRPKSTWRFQYSLEIFKSWKEKHISSKMQINKGGIKHLNIVKGYKIEVGKKGLVFKNIRFIHATQIHHLSNSESRCFNLMSTNEQYVSIYPLSPIFPITSKMIKQLVTRKQKVCH